jgi:hypothetical protein
VLFSRAAISCLPDAQVAQLVEQRTENPRVGGSIPSLGTINRFARNVEWKMLNVEWQESHLAFNIPRPRQSVPTITQLSLTARMQGGSIPSLGTINRFARNVEC